MMTIVTRRVAALFQNAGLKIVDELLDSDGA